jgi:hypothetical protein
MKVKITRTCMVQGKTAEAGTVVELPDNVGLDLINIGKGQPHDDTSMTDRAVGLTRKSAGSLVKRSAKKK